MVSAFNNSPFGEFWDNPKFFAAEDEGPDLPRDNYFRYKVFIDTDGAALVSRYQNENPFEKYDDVDLFVYYEWTDKYDIAGITCFVRMSSALKRYISENSNQRSPQWLATNVIAVYNAKKGNPAYPDIDADKLLSAIDYEVNKTKLINQANDFTYKLAAKLCKSLAKLARSRKLGEERWKYPDAKNYNPLLKDINGIKKLSKNWVTDKKKLQGYITEIRTLAKQSQRFPRFAETMEVTADIAQSLLDFFDMVVSALDKINLAIEAVNAFLCGVNNEVIEIIAGLLDLCALAFTLNNTADRKAVEEAIENAIQRFRQNPHAISDFITEKWEELQERYRKDKPVMVIAYQLGEDVLEVALLFLLVEDLIVIVRRVAKEFEGLAGWLQKALKSKATLEAENLARLIAEKYIADLRAELAKLGYDAVKGTGEIGYKGGEILSEAQFKIWEQLLLEKFDTRILTELTEEQLARIPDAAGAFDGETKTIWLKEKPTEYLLFHEMKHAEEFAIFGEEAFYKGYSIKPYHEAVWTYQREKYVYDEIRKAYKLFNDEELNHADKYIEFVEQRRDALKP